MQANVVIEREGEAVAEFNRKGRPFQISLNSHVEVLP